MDITKTSIAQPGGSIIATGSAAHKLAAELGLRAHQTVSARVSGISVVTPIEQQAILQNRASPSGPSPPGIRTLADVAQSPDVRLIALTINGRLVHALSTLPLQLLQNVQVRLDPQGNLVLVPQKAAELPAATGAPATQVAPGARPGLNGLMQMMQQNPALRTEARTALATEINRTLPQAQPLHRLLNALFKVTDSTTPATQAKDAPAVLKSLLAAIPTLDALHNSPVATLRNALQNSGTFYESRLGYDLRIGSTDHRTGEPASRDSRGALTGDLKNLLIQLIQLLQSSGSTVSGSATAENRTETLLRQLLQLMPPMQMPTKSPPDTATQLRRIETLVESALSQIQLNQYRSASAQLGETGGTVQNSVFIDLPVRLADGFISIFFQLQEYKVARRNESRKNERSTKKSRWVAFLEMEVREQSKLAVELSVTDQQVDAVFWSDDDELRRDADCKLTNLRQQLEDRGLTVTDLRCSTNPAPRKEVRLDYSLIDVKT